MSYVECVPNFSEGQRTEVLDSIRDALENSPGVVMLDSSADESHNRSVFTYVVPPEKAVDAAMAAIRRATELIDLTKHSGEHPRVGATDVFPFIPLDGTTMDQCVELARTLGRRVAEELDIPVFMYERAAFRTDRTNLAQIRKGNFEGLRESIATDPARSPDFGPARVHPTAGAIVIGARPVLVAYNVYLGDGENLPVARKVATSIRESSGGLPAVKAMGLLVDGQAQVSMNLVDINRTPVHVAFEEVRRLAAAEGVGVTWSEIIGLVPQKSIDAAAARHLQLTTLPETQILERRLDAAATTTSSVTEFLADLASSRPVPGGGTAAAHAGAVAASLVQMVAALTIGRKKYAAVDDQMKAIAAESASLTADLARLANDDAAAYSLVSAAYKLPKGDSDAGQLRTSAIDDALRGAAQVPLRTAVCCARVAALAALAAEHGNSNAVSDAGVAALLADAACRGAAFNVQINVAALSVPKSGAEMSSEASKLVSESGSSASRAQALVIAAIGA